MGLNSEISWTDGTYNVAIGCNKVNEACTFCYMMRDMGERWGKDVNGTVTRTSKATFNAPLGYQRKGMKAPDGRPFKLFTSSLTDAFHEQIDSYRHEVLEIIDACPDIMFLILTKRIERVPEQLFKDRPNVWLGTSIGMNKHIIPMAEKLCETFAHTRFLSIEPLIGPVDLEPLFRSYYQGIHWVILGGESGNETGKYRYRSSEMEWYLEIVETCRKYDVPVFVKQLGTHLAKKWNLKDRHGRDISEFPKALQVREFPKSYMALDPKI